MGEKRVGQLLTAATQRDMLAMQKTAEAEYMRSTAGINAAQEQAARTMAAQARRSEDEANLFRDKAQEAREMSAKIRERIPQYAKEEKQAAVSTVWSLLPPGIAPPAVI